MVNTICTGPAFGVDSRGDLQIRTPRPLDWPYPSDISDDNGLMLDGQQGLWVHPQESYIIWRDGYQTSPTTGTLSQGQLMVAAYDDLSITNRTGVRMWAHIIMMFRTYVRMPVLGHGGSNAKVWYDSDPEPGWGPVNECVSTTAAREYTAKESFSIDASTWIEPRQTRVIHTRHMYRVYSGDPQLVNSMQWRPTGMTFLPFPNSMVNFTETAEDLPEPDPDVSIVDFGAIADPNGTPEMAENNSKAIQDAIDSIAARGGGRVRVPDGVFLLRWSPQNPGGPMVRVADNVLIDLTPNAVLRRFGSGPVIGSLPSTDKTTGGYQGPQGWTIQGGTIDANGQWARSMGIESVTFALSHTDNGTIRDLKILDQNANHTIDSTGNRNLTVQRVRFEGWIVPKEQTEGEWAGTAWGSHGWPYIEVIQLDHAVTSSGGHGASDQTTTQDLKVLDCWFGPSASQGPPAVAIGSHGGPKKAGELDVEPFKDITVTGNTITDYLGTGIRLFAWQGATVTGNTIISRHDHQKYGRIDEGAKAPILIHTLRETNWPCTDLVIDNNTLQDTGGPDCLYAAFSIDQPLNYYNAAGTPTPYPGSEQPHVNVVMRENHSARHQGTNVFASTHAPAVVIEGNRWRDPQITGEAITADDMTNVRDNGPE